MYAGMDMEMKTDIYWPESELYEAGLQALGKKKPNKRLLNYLTRFKQDELSTGKMKRPASYESQRARLLRVMRKKLPSQGFHQTISVLDDDLPNLWELVFTMHFITGELQLTNNIGYDKGEIAPGVYRALPIAYAEFRIVDKDLQRAISSNLQSSAAASPKQAQGILAEVRLLKNAVVVQLENNERYLIKTLRNDGAPCAFMKYLLKNADNDIARAVIQTEVDGCVTKENMSELVKQCGFTGPLLPLKSLFFPGTTAKKVRLTDSVYLSPAAVKQLKAHTKQIA